MINKVPTDVSTYLCVGGAAVADGAVVLPPPAGEVLGQPPPPPPPLDLMLNLEETRSITGRSLLLQMFQFERRRPYLPVHEAVEHRDHKALKQEIW